MDFQTFREYVAGTKKQLSLPVEFHEFFVFGYSCHVLFSVCHVIELIHFNVDVTPVNDYVVGFLIRDDVNPPVTSHNYDGAWHTQDVNITLAATDAIAGVAETFYKISGGPVLNVTANWHPRITVEGNSSTLEQWRIDTAGNEESPRVLTGIKLDKTPPKIGTPSRLPEGDVQPNQTVKVVVNVNDSTSAVESVRLAYFINEGTTELEFLMTFNSTTGLYVTSFGIPGQQANTIVRYKITAYDNAGNLQVDDNTGQYCVYTVISEFPSFLSLSLLMVATLLAAIIIRSARLGY